MTQEEIISQILEYLNWHLKGARGAMSQEPYKGDFFKLFKEAYQRGYFDHSSRPMLRGDALRSIVAERWFTDDEGENEKKRYWMEKLFPKWDEWRYAWDRYDQ